MFAIHIVSVHKCQATRECPCECKTHTRTQNGWANTETQPSASIRHTHTHTHTAAAAASQARLIKKQQFHRRALQTVLKSTSQHTGGSSWNTWEVRPVLGALLLWLHHRCVFLLLILPWPELNLASSTWGKRFKKKKYAGWCIWMAYKRNILK